MSEGMRFPWEPPVRSTDEIITTLQRDLAYMVSHTAVLVHSKHASLAMLINTPRGELTPQGKCKLSDGSVLQFQDVGMPQPGAPEMTIVDLVARVWEIARELGLELS